MTRAESYIQEYPNINKAYNQIFDALQVLIEAEDSDPEVCSGINAMLVQLDEILDVVKEERDAALEENKPGNGGGSTPKFKVF